MLDIGKNLVRALGHIWPKAQTVNTLGRLTVLDSAVTVEWDEGAGESWARVLRASRVSGYVWIHGPLAVVSSEYVVGVALLESCRFDVISVSDLEEPTLTADVASIEAFARRAVSDVIKRRSFSAEEFVWATL